MSIRYPAFLVVMCGLVMALYIGCTQHNIKVSQDEPFRVDVNMRVDVYQHTVNHANAIEDLINAGAQPQSFRVWDVLDTVLFGAPAYAQDSNILQKLTPAAKQAIEGRTQRRNQLVSWQAKGVIGENADGFVELYEAGAVSGAQRSQVEQLISAENNDRRIIYQNIAQIEGANSSDIGKVYATSIQKNAPSGTPIEVYSGNSKDWRIK